MQQLMIFYILSM